MWYKTGLYALALLYIAAGINHFVRPAFYMAIMPPYIPYHAALVAISGACEALLGLLVLPKSTRRFACWGIVALLIAVFPANIQMTVDWQRTHHAHLWIAYARLPAQALLIWWAYVIGRRS